MYQNNFRRGPETKPVNVGDELEVTIEAVGEKGDGIAKKQGFVLFIPNTQQGQHVRIKVTKVLRKVGFAEVIGEAESVEETSKEQTEEAPQEEMIPEGDDSEDFGEEENQEELTNDEEQ